MTGNHGKFYSYKIYIKYPCGDSVKLFFWNIYLFSQNSFKEERERTNVNLLKKKDFCKIKVYRSSLKKKPNTKLLDVKKVVRKCYK